MTDRIFGSDSTNSNHDLGSKPSSRNRSIYLLDIQLVNVWLTSNNIFSQLQFEQWKLLFNKELYEKRDQSQFQESPITLKESLYKHFNRDTTQKPQMELLLSLKTRNKLPICRFPSFIPGPVMSIAPLHLNCLPLLLK